jgi:hypothetical protein
MEPSVIMECLPSAQSRAVHSMVSRRGAGLVRDSDWDATLQAPQSSVIMDSRTARGSSLTSSVPAATVITWRDLHDLEASAVLLGSTGAVPLGLDLVMVLSG